MRGLWRAEIGGRPVNRRTLIRSLLGSAAAGGTVMTATVTEAAPPDRPAFLLVLEAPGAITPDTADRLRTYMDKSLIGTAFEGIRIFVLGDGLKLKVIDTAGRVLTQPATVERRKRSRKSAAGL